MAHIHCILQNLRIRAASLVKQGLAADPIVPNFSFDFLVVAIAQLITMQPAIALIELIDSVVALSLHYVRSSTFRMRLFILSEFLL